MPIVAYISFTHVYFTPLHYTTAGTTNLHSESTEALRGKGYRVYPTPVLNELRGGDFHGLTKEQFKVSGVV